MPDTDDGRYSTHYRAAPGEVSLREDDDPSDEVESDEGMMSLRMPIASTGVVRNEGDDPLTTEELRGMARQVNDLTTGVFPEHGMSDAVDGGQYSQFEKLGYWSDGEIEPEASADGEDLLMATARMPDPETLPAATGDYRQALAILKSQAERGIPIDASIGWRTDEDFAGGVDLLEASIVGIGADPRTNTASADPVSMVARAAVDAGADPDALVRRVREATHNIDDPEFAEGDAVEWSWDGSPVHGRVAGVHEEFTPPEADDPITGEEGEAVYSIHEWDEEVEAFRRENVAKPESSLSASDKEMPSATDENFQSADRATYEVGDEEVTIDPPEAMVNAAQAGLDAKAEYEELSDCGTGVGEERARQIIDDEVGPEVIDEVAAYLTSHEEDVAGYSDPPSDWSEAEWLGMTGEDDEPRCGPVQYALWGGTATGTGLEYAQDKANEVAEAKGEDLPYDRTNDMSDPDDDDPTDDAQDATDGDTDPDPDTRAPDDVTADDLFTFTARHLDGMDESDLADAVDAADASYIGECNEEALADLVSVVTGAEYDAVISAMDDLMGEEQEYGDKDGEDDEEEDDDDRAADGEYARKSELESLREELDAIRSGDAELAEPPTEGDGEDTGERDADPDEDEPSDETPDPAAERSGVGDYI